MAGNGLEDEENLLNKIYSDGYKSFHAKVNICPFPDEAHKVAWTKGWTAAEGDETRRLAEATIHPPLAKPYESSVDALLVELAQIKKKYGADAQVYLYVDLMKDGKCVDTVRGKLETIAKIGGEVHLSATQE